MFKYLNTFLFIALFANSLLAQFDLTKSEFVKFEDEVSATTNSSEDKEVPEIKIQKNKVCSEDLYLRRSALTMDIIQHLFKAGRAGFFEIEPNINKDAVYLKSTPMLDNCESMISYGMTYHEGTYLTEARVSHPKSREFDKSITSQEQCNLTEGCECYQPSEKSVPICKFTILKGVDGEVSESDGHYFSLDYKGFTQCLVDSGAYNKDGSANKKNMHHNTGLNLRIDIKDIGDGLESLETGVVKWRAHNDLPRSSEFVADGCYVVQNISESEIELVSTADQAKRDLQEQKLNELATLCKNKNYDKILTGDFSKFRSDVQDIVIRSVKKDYEEFAKAIKNARSEKDLKNISTEPVDNLIAHVIDPLIKDMITLSDKAYEGDEQAKADLLVKEKELQSLIKPPYLTKDDRDKLVTSRGYGLAFEVNKVLEDATNYTAAVLLDEDSSISNPEKINARIRKNEIVYKKEVSEIKNEADRLAGKRPFDAIDTYAEAQAELDYLGMMQKDQQFEIQQLIQQVQRECPYRINQPPAPNMPWCESYEYLLLRQEEHLAENAAQQKQVELLIAKAKKYDAQHKASIKNNEEGRKTAEAGMSARERFESRRQQASISNRSYMSSNNNFSMTGNMIYQNGANFFQQPSPFGQPINSMNFPQMGIPATNGFNGYYGATADPYASLYDGQRGLGFNGSFNMGINQFRQPAYFNPMMGFPQSAQGGGPVWYPR